MPPEMSTKRASRNIARSALPLLDVILHEGEEIRAAFGMCVVGAACMNLDRPGPTRQWKTAASAACRGTQPLRCVLVNHSRSLLIAATVNNTARQPRSVPLAEEQSYLRVRTNIGTLGRYFNAIFESKLL